MNFELLIIEELEENTAIDWWNENRRRLNKLIRKFNKWQTERDFIKNEGAILLSKIQLLKEFGNENNFSDWQLEILDKMKEFINQRGIEQEENISLMQELSEGTNIDWWNENRKKINSAIKSYNKWQTKHEFDRNKGIEIIANINSMLEFDKSIVNNCLSDWQIEILEDIKMSIKSRL